MAVKPRDNQMNAIKWVTGLGGSLVVSVWSFAFCHADLPTSPVRTDAPPPVHATTGKGVFFQRMDPIGGMELRTQTTANLPDDDVVIGVVIEGQPRAYSAKYLEFPDHVYKDQVGSTHFAVTFCDVTSCTRVLHNDASHEIVVGGWTGSQMMLRINGEYWGHSDVGIPMADLAFEKLTWSEWKQKHPTTLVYTGNGGMRRKLFGDGPSPVSQEMIAGARAAKEKQQATR